MKPQIVIAKYGKKKYILNYVTPIKATEVLITEDKQELIDKALELADRFKYKQKQKNRLIKYLKRLLTKK